MLCAPTFKMFNNAALKTPLEACQPSTSQKQPVFAKIKKLMNKVAQSASGSRKSYRQLVAEHFEDQDEKFARNAKKKKRQKKKNNTTSAANKNKKRNKVKKVVAQVLRKKTNIATKKKPKKNAKKSNKG